MKLCHSLAVTDCQLKISHFIQQSRLSQGKSRKNYLGTHQISQEREQHSRSPALSFQLPHTQTLFFITVYSGLERGKNTQERPTPFYVLGQKWRQVQEGARTEVVAARRNTDGPVVSVVKLHACNSWWLTPIEEVPNPPPQKHLKLK